MQTYISESRPRLISLFSYARLYFFLFMAIGHIAGKKDDNKILKFKGKCVHYLASFTVRWFLLLAKYLLFDLLWAMIILT